jgi:hypothetical protein
VANIVTSLNWLTSWPTQCIDSDGREVTVLIGVVRTDEGLRVAQQIDDETTLILPFHTTAQLIGNLRQAISERIRRHNRGED